jgi:hypothetical protein
MEDAGCEAYETDIFTVTQHKELKKNVNIRLQEAKAITYYLLSRITVLYYHAVLIALRMKYHSTGTITSKVGLGLIARKMIIVHPLTFDRNDPVGCGFLSRY